MRLLAASPAIVAVFLVSLRGRCTHVFVNDQGVAFEVFVPLSVFLVAVGVLAAVD